MEMLQNEDFEVLDRCPWDGTMVDKARTLGQQRSAIRCIGLIMTSHIYMYQVERFLTSVAGMAPFWMCMKQMGMRHVV